MARSKMWNVLNTLSPTPAWYCEVRGSIQSARRSSSDSIRFTLSSAGIDCPAGPPRPPPSQGSRARPPRRPPGQIAASHRLLSRNSKESCLIRMAEPYRSATTRATEEVEESACKPDPVHPPRGGPATISLSACAPRRCSPAPCGLPGSSDGPPSNASCLALLRVGLAEPARSPAPLVSSYLTVSPLPRAANRAAAVCFLLRLHEVAPAWVSPAPCPSESGLSSTDPKTDRGRPADSSAREHSRREPLAWSHA